MSTPTDWVDLIFKEDIDRLHKILKRIIVIIDVGTVCPNRLEHLDLRTTSFTSESVLLHLAGSFAYAVIIVDL